MARVNWAAAAVVLGFTTSAGAADEPTVLSDFELDAITAAGVLIDVSSIAAALGDFAHTQTDANTFAFGGEHLDLGVGITTGEALACCGEHAHVEVGSAVLGVGDIVHGVTHTVKHDSRILAYGLSVGFVLALSYDKQFAARDEHLAMLEELRAALAGFRIELPDAVRGSDLSSDRWSQMIGAQ